MNDRAELKALPVYQLVWERKEDKGFLEGELRSKFCVIQYIQAGNLRMSPCKPRNEECQCYYVFWKLKESQ